MQGRNSFPIIAAAAATTGTVKRGSSIKRFPGRYVLFFILCLLLLAASPLHGFAQSSESEKVEEQDIFEILPEELLPYFQKEGKLVIPDEAQMLKICLNLFRNEYEKKKTLLLQLCILAVLAAVCAILEKNLKSRRNEDLLKLCVLCSGAGLCLAVTIECFTLTKEHLQAAASFLSAFLPVYTLAQTAMGGMSSAAVSSVGLQMLLSLITQWDLGILLPVCSACAGMDLASLIGDNEGVRALSAFFRKAFFFLLGTMTTLIVTVFAFQSVIAAKADSAALRSFRYAAGTFVPLVGQTVSETSKTLLSGLDLMRSTIGAVGVFTVLLTLLPPLISLLLYKLVFSAAGALSSACESRTTAQLYAICETTVAALAGLCAIADLSAIVSLAATIALPV